MEEFAEFPERSPFIQKRKQFLDKRLDALGRWSVYALVAVGIGVAVTVFIQVTSGQDPRLSEPFNLFMDLVFIVGAICALVVLGNGALAIWAWSTIALQSVLKTESYPFTRYWRRPYGPRVAIIVLVTVASVPAVYFRFHNPPLFFGILLLVALISKQIVAKF
jgi:hypothetical protein